MENKKIKKPISNSEQQIANTKSKYQLYFMKIHIIIPGEKFKRDRNVPL